MTVDEAKEVVRKKSDLLRMSSGLKKVRRRLCSLAKSFVCWVYVARASAVRNTRCKEATARNGALSVADVFRYEVFLSLYYYNRIHGD